MEDRTVESILKKILPKDIFKLAVENAEKERLKIKLLESEPDEEALLVAFIWSDSKQGCKYWIDVFNTYFDEHNFKAIKRKN